MPSKIVTINQGDGPRFEITAVRETEVIFVEDVQRRKWPSARLFRDMGEIEGKLAGMGAAIPKGEIYSRLDAILDEVQDLKHYMADCRDDAYSNSMERTDLLMGNLEQLPEVGLSNEPNRLHMMCPWCRGENTYEDVEYTLHCFDCGETFDAIECRPLQELAEGNAMFTEAVAHG